MPTKNDLSTIKGREGLTPVLPDNNQSGTSFPKQQAKPKVKRITKGFQVEQSRAHKWNMLVARLKAEGKTAPQLIDEALDYLFEKYKA